MDLHAFLDEDPLQALVAALATGALGGILLGVGFQELGSPAFSWYAALFGADLWAYPLIVLGALLTLAAARVIRIVLTRATP